MAEKKKKKSLEDQLKAGEIEMVDNTPPPSEVSSQNTAEDPTKPTLETYLAILQQLRTQKRHLTSAPTFTPKNFYESIQFYDTGGTRRLYLYVNKTWRYVALT